MKNLLNTQVGWVRINTPIVYTNKSYECAAWWQESTSDTGVFPLFLRQKDRYSVDFIVVADIPATVTDDYFPALWGGVAISNEPYKPKYIGKESKVSVSSSLMDAIQNTGVIPGRDVDWYVNPEIWKQYIQNREEELRAAYADLPKWWAEYNAEEDEYHSRVGMVAHVAEHIVQYSREIQCLYRAVGYLEQATDMWRELHKKNTEWIKKSA